jgi:hypothetical protein
VITAGRRDRVIAALVLSVRTEERRVGSVHATLGLHGRATSVGPITDQHRVVFASPVNDSPILNSKGW